MKFRGTENIIRQTDICLLGVPGGTEDYRKNKGEATFKEIMGRIFHAFSNEEAQ